MRTAPDRATVVADTEQARRKGEGTKLLWVNHFALPPGEGGGTRHYEIGRELLSRGWQVTVAASDFHLHKREYTRRAGEQDRRVIGEAVDDVKFRWFWAAPYRTNDWRRGRNWLSFMQSLSAWEPEGDRPDLVIGSSPHLFAALGGMRLANRFGVPFVLEVRDLWPESILAAGGQKGPAYWVFERIAHYLYARAERIICLARGTIGHLEGLGIAKEKLVYVPNGVDPSAFGTVKRLGRDTFTLVYAGAHGPANGLEVVLEAAERLRGESKYRFLFVGDGPTKEALVASASQRGLPNVEFRSPVPKRDMGTVFAEADAGLMILRDTPLFAFGVSPNKLFDYFGAGLPVVCNVPGEVAGLVAEAGAGVQAAAGSGASLADAVVRLGSLSPSDRTDMGERARAWVTREHGRAVLADRLDGPLRELILA